MVSSDIEAEVIDESEKDDEEIPYKYLITSYGADYPVESIVKKLEKESIQVPPFQRDYIWTHSEASRFVESLLLGLPVPGVFLSKDEETQNLLVIDGQQRLRSLQYFYDGIFRRGPASGKAFLLKNVQTQYEGKTYKTLEREDQLRLDDSIIHTTIVKQDDPEGDNSSTYLIFERLNTSGRQLYPQEIRNCIFHGELNDVLKELNTNSHWRKIFGKESTRQKDLELILRFFSMYFLSDKYQRPMKAFLNTYMGYNRHLKKNSAEELRQLFSSAIDVVYKALSEKAFHPERALNAAVFDAVMVGAARRLQKGVVTDLNKFKEKYESLLLRDDFEKAYKTATSDAENVKERLKLATEAFEGI